MGLHFAIVFHPIEMSQRLLNLSLRFFVLATVLLAESGSSTFNITRFTTGDVFQNTNSSQSCNESGASCVFDGENSPFCGVNCCNCYCPSESPTYLMKDGNCSSESHLMSILKAQSKIQGCDHRMVVAKSHVQCTKEVLTTLNTLSPGNKTLYLCPWSKKPKFTHFLLVKNLQRCEIVPEESLYLVNGSWETRLRDDPVLSKLSVEIGEDPAFDNDMLLLKWIADVGKQYDGLIFSLKLRCRGKQGNVLNSCVHFKKGGSFTDIKPALKPAAIKSTRASTSSIQQTTTETTTAATTLTPAEKSSPSTTHVPAGKSSPSTAHVPYSPVLDDVGVTSLTVQSQNNIVVIILSALAGALFVLLAVLAVFFFHWRRRRRFDVEKDNKNVLPATNPIYERGASDTLKMSKIPNGNGQTVEEWPEYQPLVENTKPRERSDSLPGYAVFSTGQRPNQQPTSNRVIRSSNYLSLFKDDPEVGRDYQTLVVKDRNSQKMEIVDEEKIPEYAVLEERSDSEDSFDSSDSKDYEEPPVDSTIFRSKHSAPQREELNDLSSDFHDYDEPEGVIVISDNEDDSHVQAPKENNDFHDYADPDDTDEDNVNCHVTSNEVPSCYHDYDDPE